MRRRTIKNIIAGRRVAYSLTELLIVMVIIVLIMSASLPVAKRVLDEGRVREASRQLNAYISMAKTRAVLTGRPCGVYFELAAPVGASTAATNMGPFTPMNPAVYSRQSTRMYMAETPPPYSGSVTGAKARLMWWPKTGMSKYVQFCPVTPSLMTPGQYDRDDFNEMPILRTLIDDGEKFLVRFDYKGPWYKCQRGDSDLMQDPNNFYVITVVVGSLEYPVTLTDATTPVAPGYIADPANEGYTNPGYSYQIIRSPRRVGNPLELTGGTCVDMNYSGMGLANNNSFRLASEHMSIMFTPSGGVTGIYGDEFGPNPPEGTVHFLVGRTTKVNDPWAANPAHPSNMNMFDSEKSNLADPGNLWVSIGRSNGTTTSAENVSPPTWTDYTPTGQASYLSQARSIATGREQTGGR